MAGTPTDTFSLIWGLTYNKRSEARGHGDSRGHGEATAKNKNYNF